MFRRLFMSAVALTVIFGGFGVVYGDALEPSHHYTWGINNPQAIDLSSGRIITEAVLTFHNFNSSVKDQVEVTTSRSTFRGGTTTNTTLTNVPNYDSLSIYVLDNPRYGFQSLGSYPVDPFVGCGGKLTKGVLEQVDSERYNLICRLGDTHSDHSPFSSLFNAPVALTLAGGSSVVLSSALLEFIDYAGTGPSAGFGLWPGNVQYSYDDITLTLTVGAYQGDSTAQTLTFRIGDDMNPIGENPVQPEPEVFYTLDVFAANGTIAKSPNLTSYAQGDLVTLTATAAADYTFSHWSGDASGTNSSVTVTMDADKSVTANFTQNAAPTYTVTFNLDGKGTRTGGGALIQTIAHGAAATAPTVAASTGWVFTGWDKAFSNITGNLTVNAQYTAQSYTVTFNLDNKGTRTGGGALVQTIAHGAAATAPTVAAGTGWVFTGWDKAFNNITGNLTVNAQYTVQTYTVTFNLDNKGTRTGGGALIQTIAHGAAATAPTVAASTGWVFTGWDKAFNNITGNLTVNAQYTAQTYTVTFNLDNKGTRTGGGALIQTIAHGAAATAPTVAASTGWVFTGWDKAFNNITGNLTVNAQYTAQTYTVTFNLDNKGTRTGGGALVQTIAHGAAAIAPTVAAGTGWVFTGWDKAFNNITGNLTVNAQYTAQTYTLNITSASGSVIKRVNGVITTATSFAHGTVVSLTAVADTGYTFGNWSGSVTGTANPISITMDGNKSVTANYTQNAAQTYTLAITATNGSVTVKINGVVTTATSFEAGTVVELTAAADSGYTFGGWSGGVSGTANPVFITMNGNKSVTAAFNFSRSSFR